MKFWKPRALMFKGREIWMSQLKHRERICPFSACLFYFGFQRIGWGLPTLIKETFFTKSTYSQENLFQKHLHRHTQECFTSSLGTRLEKERTTHSSTLAWKIPGMEGPGRLQVHGSLRVGHNWTTSLSLFTFMHWRTKWQTTPVFLPGDSQGWGSLVGCRQWSCTELDTTAVT